MSTSLRHIYATTGETLGNQYLVDTYFHAYNDLYGRQPTECRYVEGTWFLINGIYRDRQWIMQEIERIRNLALDRSLRKKNHDSEQKTSILRLIKRLSGL